MFRDGIFFHVRRYPAIAELLVDDKNIPFEGEEMLILLALQARAF